MMAIFSQKDFEDVGRGGAAGGATAVSLIGSVIICSSINSVKREAQNARLIFTFYTLRLSIPYLYTYLLTKA